MSSYKVMDGNTAAAHVAYALSDNAAIFPITPSSPMAEMMDKWSATGRKNIFGSRVRVKEMQSEGGASGAVHGSLMGGALTSTFTSSQGLMLMIPSMYKIAGELLPGVFHVASRSLSSNIVSIFGDHQDVMSVRQTGFTLLSSTNVQQCMDLAAVAHMTAIDSSLPVLHFFEGFRSSHELQKIEVLDDAELASLIDMEKVVKFRERALTPDAPAIQGLTANPDIFFQYRESANLFHEAVPGIVQKNMDKLGELTGRHYRLFDYYGAADAENIIVIMGSGADTVKETIDYLNERGRKLGVVEVHLFRPFSVRHLREAVPVSVRKIAVLDRTKEPGGREPLYLDVRSAFYGAENAPLIVGGRYGLGSKEFGPGDVLSVFENLEQEQPMDDFTVGITDDVSFKSLPLHRGEIDPSPEGTTACMFWGLGSDGTVGANKSAIKIIGEHSDMYTQAYFAYDSKKSGGLTVSHLRFGHRPILSRYAIEHADYVACHNQSYIGRYDMLKALREHGIFLLNCGWTPETAAEHLPASVKKKLAEKKAEFYVIDAASIAAGLGLGSRINMIMQAAFFALAGIIDRDEAVKYLKEQVLLNYGAKGDDVVEMNYKAIEAGASSYRKVPVPAEWLQLEAEKPHRVEGLSGFTDLVINEMNRQEGDAIPVSAFKGIEGGAYPAGISQYEKRGIALKVPEWDSGKCVQCNSCALACPHAAIRPYLLTQEEAEQLPGRPVLKKAVGFSDKFFMMGISNYDCTGCGNCLDICPAEGALVMKPFEEKKEEKAALWDILKDKENDLEGKAVNTIKMSQFRRPLLEFSGACAGCGETPYVKLLTQLYGDRMVITNPAGCTVVWGASPASAYTTDNKGHGPAYAYSLFEDTGEYGYGIYLAERANRNYLKAEVEKALETELPGELPALLRQWLGQFDSADGTRELADRIMAELEKYKECCETAAALYHKRHFFLKRAHWIVGGDGWAYDIGYGGLDHVLAAGENVNVMVLDTEVYSNTGGQASKSTPTAAIVKFEAGGKNTRKKDLGMAAINYGYIYVAQIALGADRAQAMRVIREAESYPGPSLIIAYAPCINHGIRAGMGATMSHEKLAVETGYWTLYHYDPRLQDEGKNPFVLDSKAPSRPYSEFLMSEVRYTSLLKQFPEYADSLLEKAAGDAAYRYRNYLRMAGEIVR